MKKGPLSKLKVLELASVLAGPSVGQFFAELGATVIKVENVRTEGDVTRSWVGKEENVDRHRISAYFSSVNWGKKSLALDLTTDEGKDIVHKLIPQTDVVITSYKSGDDLKLQVDYNTLKAINPSIIYGHITGYGADNKKTGYDAVIQAETGFMYMNGEPDGTPLKMPVALIDILSAHHLKEGILLALLNRSQTGIGDYVHVSLFDAALASLANQATNWLVAHKIPARMGQEHPNIAPYGKSYRTKDSKNILFAIGTNSQFEKLCEVLGLEDLVFDSRFKSNTDRVQNRNMLNNSLSEKIVLFNAADLIDVLINKSVPCGLINSMDEVFKIDQSHEMLLTPLNSGSTLKGIRNVAFSLGLIQSTNRMSPPPSYGEHSLQILSSLLNYSPDNVQKLRDKGIIA